MKKTLAFMLLVTVIIISFTGCTKAKGSYVDFASIKDAQRTMVKLSNLMEQYYVNNGRYPGADQDFETEMKEYFVVYNRNNEPVDKWKEMITDVFQDGKLIYMSPDPQVTYFIYGRANDSNGTLVFCRPALPHEPFEEKTTKK